MPVSRLRRSVDFQRLLGTPVKQRSTHFAIHHVAEKPSLNRLTAEQQASDELSTAHATTCPPAVDDRPESCWLGCMVPKRHARRAVTRSLLKRQMRAASERVHVQLPEGLTLIRLRQPFATQQYPSALSDALRKAVRDELDQLMQRFVSVARPAQRARY
jgi:ribonuclease P protein component